jgi:gamma-glutamylcyclotransferase (GGCT)/AIG2-like uncharacterized protein YtfP
MSQLGNGADSDALVFVYGSLKRGMANHHQLLGARPAGPCLLEGLDLYDLGPFPMAVPSGRAQAKLKGELYWLSASQLKELDRFEGTPRLYERKRWLISAGSWCWVYLGRPRQVRYVEQLKEGEWRGPRHPTNHSRPDASKPSNNISEM